MLPYPHHFITPNNIEIDLRLHNRDLQTRIKSIVSSLLTKNTPKNWFSTTKRRLINQYKRKFSSFSDCFIDILLQMKKVYQKKK
jgi:hypothetical protein